MSILTQTSKSYSGFTPLSIPGCSLWLDAADSSSLTLSGSSVTQWNDKSGNGLNVSAASSQPTYTQNVVGNLGGVTFNGSQSLSRASVLGSSMAGNSTTTFTVFSVGSYTNNTQRSIYYTWFGNVSQTIRMMLYYDGTGGHGFDFNDYPYRTNIESVTPPSNNLLLYSGVRNGSTGTLNINGGTNTATATGLTTTNFGSTAATLTIGAFPTDPTWNMKGNICEIIFYSSALSTSQIQQVEGYLARKWGLISNTSFSPTSIPGCQLWLDAADSSTVTITNGSISGVSDKSGNGYNLTGGIAFTYNTTLFQGKYPSFFNTSSAADGKIGSNASFNLNQPMTVFATGVMTVGNNDMIFDGNTKRIALYNSTANLFAGPGDQISTATNYLLSPYVVCGVANTTNSAVFVNGTNVVSGTIGTDPLTSIVVGNRTGGSGSPYRGHLCEFIIFNSSLSTSQRQQVENYLGRKWGIYPVIPNTHPYKLTPLYSQPFSPIDVPGCALWLDAADNSTLSLSGSTVTNWADKSGTGLTSTPSGSPTIVTNALNGLSAVSFNGSSQYFNFGNVNNIGTNQLHIFVVAKFNSTADGSIIAKSLYGPGVGRYFIARSGASLIPGLETSTNNSGTGASDTSTTARLINMHWDRSALTMYLNGTSAVSLTNADASTNLNNTYSLLVGAYNNGTGGVPPQTGLYFNGYIMEIIQYLGQITTSQRQQVEGYLTKKWGLQGSLVSTHPFKLYPPLTPVFNPLQISGCALWLDALDRSTITLSGSSVTQWNDKSGNGYNFTASGTGLTYVSSGIKFVDNNYMVNSSITAFQNANTLFMVLKATGINSSGIGNVFYYGSDATTDGYGYRILAPGTGSSTSYSWDVTPPGNGGNLDWNGNATLYVNGVTGTANTYSIYNQAVLAAPGNGGVGAGGSALSGVTLSRSYNNRFYNGYIYEVMLFNSKLSTYQRQQIEAYLAGKWGLRTLPSTHPYKMFSTPFSPSQISGLSLWLDASDLTSLTLSGSSVTQWNDKSGNGRNATNVGTITTTITNGLTALDFSNNRMTIASYPWSAYSTIFFVVKSTNGNFLFSQSNGTSYRNFYYTGNWPLFVVSINDGASNMSFNDSVIPTGTVVPTNTYFMFALGYNGGTAPYMYHVNGTARSTGTGPGLSNGTSTFPLYINGNSSGAFDTSVVCEIYHYTNAFTTAQRQQVEGYLAWKWGLQANLPSGHPYRYSKP